MIGTSSYSYLGQDMNGVPLGYLFDLFIAATIYPSFSPEWAVLSEKCPEVSVNY